MIKHFLANNLPFIGKYKRFLVALRDSISPTKKTYSQHQEDQFILSCLLKFDMRDSIYVDIGANHPTDISNTYLLYRHGLKGLIVEPNDELGDLFRRFRKRDDVLMIGCGNTTSVFRFNISKTPVISSFSDVRDVNVHRTMYVPILPLDIIVQHIPFSYISLLTIDVEGLNIEVVKGAVHTIKRALLVCVEFDEEKEKPLFQNLLGSDFNLLATYGCNLIFLNQPLSEKVSRALP